MIRELQPEDAGAVAGLLLALNPHQVLTPEMVLQRASRTIEHERRRSWVAEAGGEVVGSADPGFEWPVPTPGKGRFWIGVLPQHRGGGVGAALYDEVSRYLRSLGAWRLRTWVDEDPAGERFLERRGLERRGSDRVSELVLAGAALPEPAVPRASGSCRCASRGTASATCTRSAPPASSTCGETSRRPSSPSRTGSRPTTARRPSRTTAASWRSRANGRWRSRS